MSAKESIFFYEKNIENSLSPEELLLELTNAISDKEELQEKFSEVIIIYSTNLYALVPSPLFNETKASEYLKLNSKILANDFVAYDTLENNDLTVVYIPYININNYIYERFGLFKYYHSTTLLLKYVLNIEKHKTHSIVYLNVMNELFDFITLTNGDLVLCNTYEYKSPEDFIYYILFSLEQLKLNPDTIEIMIAGNIEEKDDIFKMLYTYIRNISFIKPDVLPINLINDKAINHHNLLLKLAQ